MFCDKVLQVSEEGFRGYKVTFYGDEQEFEENEVYLIISDIQHCCEETGAEIWLEIEGIPKKSTEDKVQEILEGKRLIKTEYDRSQIIGGDWSNYDYSPGDKGHNQTSVELFFEKNIVVTLIIYNLHNGYYSHDFKVRYYKNSKFITETDEL